MLPKVGITLVKAVLFYLVNKFMSHQSHSHKDLQSQEYIESCTITGNNGGQDASPPHQSTGLYLVVEQFERNVCKTGDITQ